MPPPSWAYPYATMWEDFETSGSLTTSTSGGTYSIASGGTYILGGLTGGGRTGVGSSDPSTLIGSSAEAGIAVPGADSQGVYLKFEAYAEDANSAYDFFLDDTPSPRQNPHQFDFAWNQTAPFVTYADNTGGTSDFDEYDLVTFPDWVDSAWHAFEFQLFANTVTVLVDDVVVGTSALLYPTLTPLYAGFLITYSTTFGGRVWLDNFQAGPWDGGIPTGPATSASDLLGLSDDYLTALTAVTPPVLGSAMLRTPSLSFQSP